MASGGKMSGEDVLRKSYIQQHKPWQSYRLVGPFEDAKPESKIIIVNVPRHCQGDSWHTYMNANNSLVALNTLEQAGHKNPTIALPKANSTSSSTNVAVGKHGNRSIIAYDDLTFHNAVPNGATLNGADSLGSKLHGVKVHDFDDVHGHGIVLEDFNRVDLASRVNRIAVPGLSLWGTPTEPGMVANLGPMAGDYLKGLQDQNLMQQLRGSGETQLMSQILDRYNATQGPVSSDTGDIERRIASNTGMGDVPPTARLAEMYGGGRTVAAITGGTMAYPTHIPHPMGAGGRQTRF